MFFFCLYFFVAVTATPRRRQQQQQQRQIQLSSTPYQMWFAFHCYAVALLCLSPVVLFAIWMLHCLFHFGCCAVLFSLL